ncbi:hypothetical protein FRAAL4694 [Frankia alni ACN14a]|uniref:Uncharacterized protein n=1 Tax=Frankia alni (strain DSM 45986 / CECT 9034 / ACN14a) TaxID=326424 RepID=Q0RGQ0_FRAAA|nr:hypothetical protein FRAAL4694 [Frankia alni ACN14a]
MRYPESGSIRVDHGGPVVSPVEIHEVRLVISLTAIIEISILLELGSHIVTVKFHGYILLGFEGG